MKTYQLTIDTKKEKTLVAFLKQLDFVKVRKIQNDKRIKITKPKNDPELPYFGAYKNW